MADLENGDESAWMSQIPGGLKYAVLHWADHVKLSQDTSEDLAKLILEIFQPGSAVLDKWWIMFMTWNYGISQYPNIRRRYTTPLHMFALLGRDQLLLTSGPDRRFDDYNESQDAQGLEPLDVAILHNHDGMVNLLLGSYNFTITRQCVFAASSSVKVARMIFPKHNPRVQQLPEEDIKLILWHTCYSGDPDLLDSTIRFVIGKTSGRFFPWNITTYAEDIINSGDRRLLIPILATTNMKEQAHHVIEYATSQHEPYMLEEILRYKVVSDMMRAKQIDLRRALNTALVRRNVHMTALLLNEDTMDYPEGAHRRPLKWAVKHPSIHTLVLFLAQPNFPFNKGVIEEDVALNFMLHKASVTPGVGLQSLEQLLQRGARMRYEDFGITALHVAAQIGRVEVMQILLDNLTEEEIREDLDRKCSAAHKREGKDGKMALAVAAIGGRVGVAQLLVGRGANISVEDGEGKTALQLAREAGKDEVVGMLEEVEEDLGVGGSRGEGEGRKRWKGKGKM